jgi:hypothetical protein
MNWPIPRFKPVKTLERYKTVESYYRGAGFVASLLERGHEVRIRSGRPWTKSIKEMAASLRTVGSYFSVDAES